MNETVSKTGRRPTSGSSRLSTAALAGCAGITVNTALLFVADHFRLVTARGGLLTLLAQTLGMSALPLVRLYAFQQVFHIAVGIAMAVFYSFTFARLPTSALIKGLLYALAVWLLNACMVLPLIGQGFAGHSVLTAGGMLFFAIAHTAFFVVTALLYQRWQEH
ncbi:hypothetical protein LMG31506_06418 [Cupriavidus yeoncheonensis]|uniref:DUF1440 domain-containing protein n=1 Tax=Cupriavidus yeoncheonensis TaxID=1462994 RepID=A0A916J413_9BURK|nr:hypothetical protein [Cupriavidus yeoncheonensis]CAG2158568.1 hypothetical protein LMG31506_06418 [Cupriavidus yeoncheonensis]